MACNQVPKKRLAQFKNGISYDLVDGKLMIEIKNPVKCPLRIRASSGNEIIEKGLKQYFPIILNPLGDTTIVWSVGLEKEEFEIQFSSMFGSLDSPVDSAVMSLPFPSGKWYRVIQGYNGKFSHQSDYSRYAIDFALGVGDTICSAADGVVVGLIKDYKRGGDSKKWRDYANYITLFHPELNLYTQYVHLMHEGSFVNVGDTVVMGQVIGLSGMTGFTSRAHLHFNVLKTTSNNLISTPVSFREGYRGAALKKGKKAVKRR